MFFCRQYYFFWGVAHPSPRKPRYWLSIKAIPALFSPVWRPSTGCPVCGGCGSAAARALSGAYWAKLGQNLGKIRRCAVFSNGLWPRVEKENALFFAEMPVKPVWHRRSTLCIPPTRSIAPAFGEVLFAVAGDDRECPAHCRCFF